MSENSPSDIMEITLGPKGDYLHAKAAAGKEGDIARQFITGLAMILSGQSHVLLRNRYDGENTETVSRNLPSNNQYGAAEDAESTDAQFQSDSEKERCPAQTQLDETATPIRELA